MVEQSPAATAGAQPSPLDAWEVPTGERELPLASGRVVVVRPLDLTAELLAGSLPNQVLDWVIFGSLGRDAHKQTYQQHVKTVYEAKLMTVARGLARPKLVLGPPDNVLKVMPDKAKGEIGPRQLHPREIDEIYNYLINGVLPDAASAPFPAQADDAGGAEPAARAGDDISPEPERIPGADGE